MKFNKIFAIALTAVALTACSDDDNKNNTAPGVSVEFQSATLDLPEDQPSSATYYQIPIVVTGDANGPIQVTVEVGQFGEHPATEGADFIITSKTLNIPAGKSEIGVELYPTGNDVLNDDRQFILTITSANGASIGSNKSIVVSLLDNEYLLVPAYTGMQGMWTLEEESEDHDTYQVEFTGVEEGEPGYCKTLTLNNFLDMGIALECNMSVNAVTKQVYLNFPLGQELGVFTFNGIGNCMVKLAYYDDSGYAYTPSASILGTSNADMNKVTFDHSPAGFLFTEDGSGFLGYIWFVYENMTLTR